MRLGAHPRILRDKFIRGPFSTLVMVVFYVYKRRECGNDDGGRGVIEAEKTK